MAQTASDHARVILSAIIPARRDLLDKALRHLTPAHFPEQIHSNLFIMLERYLEVTGSVMTGAALGDLLSNSGADAGKALLYQETYDLLAATAVPDADFLWSLEQIRELAADRATQDVLLQAMEILNRGATGEKGERLHGHLDARTHILTKLAEIDRELSMQDAPEGNMRHEGDQMLQSYADQKRLKLAGKGDGLLFGVPELDAKVGGLQPGELDLLAGYTSSGKTSMGVQLSWNVAVRQGKNVVIATTETLRAQVQRKLLCRHSLLPQFGLPEGINSQDLKNGTLPEVQEAVLKDIIYDFTKNPSYGNVYIIQVPRGATVSNLESRLQRVNREFEVHLCLMDYLQLLRAERGRQDDRQEQSSIVKDSKAVATTFDDGRGITVVSPWQVNRAARDNAEKAGFYTLNGLSETAEASNTPDVVVSMLEPSEKPSRYVDIKAQVLKNRDGETAGSILMRADYATSSFTTQAKAESMDALLGGPSSDSSFI